MVQLYEYVIHKVCSILFHLIDCREAHQLYQFAQTLDLDTTFQDDSSTFSENQEHCEWMVQLIGRTEGYHLHIAALQVEQATVCNSL